LFKISSTTHSQWSYGAYLVSGKGDYFQRMQFFQGRFFSDRWNFSQRWYVQLFDDAVVAI